jgi:hypothetical protein
MRTLDSLLVVCELKSAKSCNFFFLRLRNYDFNRLVKSIKTMPVSKLRTVLIQAGLKQSNAMKRDYWLLFSGGKTGRVSVACLWLSI